MEQDTKLEDGDADHLGLGRIDDVLGHSDLNVFRLELIRRLVFGQFNGNVGWLLCRILAGGLWTVGSESTDIVAMSVMGYADGSELRGSPSKGDELDDEDEKYAKQCNGQRIGLSTRGHSRMWVRGQQQAYSRSRPMLGLNKETQARPRLDQEGG